MVFPGILERKASRHMGIGNPLQLQGKLQNMLKKILHENSGLINFPELSEFDFI